MTVNDAALEAAAEGFYMSGPGGADKHWDDIPSARKAHFRSRARIALKAAAPHMLAGVSDDALRGAWDRGYGTGQDGMTGALVEAWDAGFDYARTESWTEDANPYR